MFIEQDLTVFKELGEQIFSVAQRFIAALKP